jgi:hypothetical protein
MMQTYIGTPVERHSLFRRLDLPEGHHLTTIGDKNGGVVRPLADNGPSEAVAEETAGGL